MYTPTSPGALVRELSRLFVRSQRAQSACVDGASNVQCHVLTELLRVDGLTQQALVERLSLDKAWISRAVDALVSDGVVAKRPHEDDKRSVKLSLTALGRIRAEKLEATLNAHAAQVFEHIAPAQHAKIQDALTILVLALTQATQTMQEPQTMQATQTTPANVNDAAKLVLAERHQDTLQFEAATMKDLAAIEAMLEQANLPTIGVRQHLAHFRLGKRAGKIVALGGLELYGAQALLRSVVVDTTERNKAYGKQMVKHLYQLAQQSGVHELYLRTMDATPYFAHLGFQELAYDQVPAGLKRSSQFRGVCPASATVMHRSLFT